MLGALSVVVSPPSRAWRSAPREAHWLGALRSPGLLALLGAFFFVGIALGSITVAAVRVRGRARRGRGVRLADGRRSGWARWSAASAYGARQWAGAPERRLRVLVGLLAVCYLPLTLMPGAVAMTALTALAGVFLAPALACAFVVVDRHAPRGHGDRGVLLAGDDVRAWARRSERRLAGPVVERGGALCGLRRGRRAAGSLSLLVLLATRRVLAVPGRSGGGCGFIGK